MDTGSTFSPAGHTLSLGATLVTNNVDDFSRVNSSNQFWTTRISFGGPESPCGRTTTNRSPSGERS